MMRGKGRGERVFARRLTSYQWSLSHAQIDRESCFAGSRYSPGLFPCLLVYKRRCTSKSHSTAGAVRAVPAAVTDVCRRKREQLFSLHRHDLSAVSVLVSKQNCRYRFRTDTSGIGPYRVPDASIGLA